MARQKTVVDTSVAVKWFVQEEYGPQADALLNQHFAESILLIAPDLLAYEVTNALLYKKMGIERAQSHLLDLFDYQIHFERASPILIKKTFDFGQTHNITAYDASYVALCELHQADLFTADERLLAKKIPHVRHIKEFQL